MQVCHPRQIHPPFTLNFTSWPPNYWFLKPRSNLNTMTFTRYMKHLTLQLCSKFQNETSGCNQRFSLFIYVSPREKTRNSFGSDGAFGCVFPSFRLPTYSALGRLDPQLKHPILWYSSSSTHSLNLVRKLRNWWETAELHRRILWHPFLFDQHIPSLPCHSD